MRGRVVHAPLDQRPPIRMLSSNRGCGNPHGPANHRPEVGPLFGPPPDPPADRGGSGDRGSVFPLPPHRAGEDPLRAPSRDDREGRLQGRGRPRDAGDLGAPRHPDVAARARGPRPRPGRCPGLDLGLRPAAGDRGSAVGTAPASRRAGPRPRGAAAGERLCRPAPQDGPSGWIASEVWMAAG